MMDGGGRGGDWNVIPLLLEYNNLPPTNPLQLLLPIHVF